MAARTSRDQFSRLGQNLLRILIASYFIAVAIGLIAGTDGTPLASVYLSPEPAALIGRSAFFILGYLVLTGIWLRPAAMLLAITFFWSSFILHFGAGATAPIGDFWRDLALVGALALTFARLSPNTIRQGATFLHSEPSSASNAQSRVSPRRVVVAHPSNVARLAPSTKLTPRSIQTENIFRDDLEELLAS